MTDTNLSSFQILLEELAEALAHRADCRVYAEAELKGGELRGIFTAVERLTVSYPVSLNAEAFAVRYENPDHLVEWVEESVKSFGDRLQAATQAARLAFAEALGIEVAS